MGFIRSLVAAVLTIGLIPTVAVAHLLRLSNNTLFETRLGAELLANLELTQSQVGLATAALLLAAVVLVGLIFLVSRSLGTTFRALGASLVIAGGPVYAFAYVLENQPEPVITGLSSDMQTLLYDLSSFADPFIGTVGQQSLILLVAGVGLFVVARAVSASQS